MANRIFALILASLPLLCAAQQDPARRDADSQNGVGPAGQAAGGQASPSHEGVPPADAGRGPSAIIHPIVPAGTPPPAGAAETESSGTAASGTDAPPAVAIAKDDPAATPAPVVRSGIALILPAKASPFGRAADAVRQGFMAARVVAGNKPEVRVFDADGSAVGVRAAFALAEASNPAVIVGPLTKTEVGAVLDLPLLVPTLALNAPEDRARLPPNFYALSLNTESEARAAAAAAFRQDATVALVVTTGAPLSARAAAAFSGAWVALGGSVRETIEFTGSLGRLRQAAERARGDIVFLAVDAERAKLMRPYLGRNVQMIGTSQVYGGAARSETYKAHDLNGLRFVDMPWLHQPDHAGVMVFPRPETAMSADLERLYALGVDAFRIAAELARARTEFTVDGVTGSLAVHAGVIERVPLQFEYRDGAVVPVSER